MPEKDYEPLMIEHLNELDVYELATISRYVLAAAIRDAVHEISLLRQCIERLEREKTRKE